MVTAGSFAILTGTTVVNTGPTRASGNVGGSPEVRSSGYHTEFGGKTSRGVPEALRPGRYRFVTFLNIGGKTVRKEKQFTIGTTTFIDGIVINY